MLSVGGLYSGYGDANVLFGVDVEVREGEIVALLGSNGAGKTTLLMTLAGLLPPSSGEVRFEGRVINPLRAAERVDLGIALVPEGRHLFSGMTVDENLQMGAHRRRDRAAVARDMGRVFELFPVLLERRTQLVGRMSGGEQQMCAIARGLLSAPRLLMIDELSAGLAPLVVKSLAEALRAIRQEGVTILIVEQDVRTALQIADRGYVLETGSVVMSGASSDLRSDPAIRGAYLGM